MGFLDFLKKGEKKQEPEIDLDEVRRKIEGGSPKEPPMPPPGPSDKSGPKADSPPFSMDAPPKDVRPSPKESPARDVPPPPAPSGTSKGDVPRGKQPAEPQPPKETPPEPPGVPPPGPPKQDAPPEPPQNLSARDSPAADEPDLPPEPPENLREPDFLQDAADDMKKPDLPDFSDEEIAALEKPAAEHEPWKPPKQPASPPKPVPPPMPASPPKRAPVDAPKERREEPSPEPQRVAPPKGHAAFRSLEPARFLSSDTYFAIQADMRKVRKTLRDSDNLLKDALSDHEKGDEQLERFAAEVNSIQESFIGLDEALFEE